MPLLRDLPPERLTPIRLLVLDVDGVLTDGSIVYDSSGAETKRFNVRDGSGVKYWKRTGHLCAFLSGRSSPVVARRAEELSVDVVRMGEKNKRPALEAILEQLACAPEETAYVGDDLPDIPAMRLAGLSVAVADACEETRDFADATTEHRGGDGAVREVVEILLRASNRWAAVLARYFPEGEDAP